MAAMVVSWSHTLAPGVGARGTEPRQGLGELWVRGVGLEGTPSGLPSGWHNLVLLPTQQIGSIAPLLGLLFVLFGLFFFFVS